MNIHAICLVKNEADVIRETLLAASSWCDHIYILDNGSNDGTWAIVQELARDYAQIVPYKVDGGAFSDAMRSEVFNQYRDNANVGDWWIRLDADEIYSIDDPKVFFSKIPSKYNRVWGSYYEYFFTDRDLALWEQDPAHYAPEIPLEHRYRYYLNDWSEMRSLRMEKGLVWQDTDWPIGDAAVYPTRLRFRHYKFRSPPQIQQRLRTRQAAIESGEFKHELLVLHAHDINTQVDWDKAEMRPKADAAMLEWRDKIVSAESLHYDNLDGNLIPGDDMMPPIPKQISWLRRKLRNLRKRLASV